MGNIYNMSEQERRQVFEDAQKTATVASDGTLVSSVQYVRFQDPYFGGPDEGRYLRVHEAIDYDTWAMGNEGTGIWSYTVDSAAQALSKLKDMGLENAKGADQVLGEVEREAAGLEPSKYLMPVLDPELTKRVHSPRDMIYYANSELEAQHAAYMTIITRPYLGADGSTMSVLCTSSVFPDKESAWDRALNAYPRGRYVVPVVRLSVNDAKEFGAALDGAGKTRRDVSGLDAKDLTPRERCEFIWAIVQAGETTHRKPLPWHTDFPITLAGPTIEDAARGWIGQAKERTEPQASHSEMSL